MKLSDAKNIAADYGEVIAAGPSTGGTTYPISSIPYPIEDIKKALVYCYLYAGYPEEHKDALGSVYAMLGSFIEDEKAKIEGEQYRNLQDGNIDKWENPSEINELVSKKTADLLREWDTQVEELTLIPPEMTDEERNEQHYNIILQNRIKSEKEGDELYEKWGKFVFGLIVGSVITFFLLS